jgi:amino acid adenylation domain-containing protein
MLNYSESKAVAGIENIKERDYWLNKLSGRLVKSVFTYDFNKSGLDDYGMETVNSRFTGEIFSKLMQYSKESDYTLHIILAAGVAALLEKYTGLNDIIVGSPICKQESEGEFINTVLVLRSLLQDGMTFKELLMMMRETVLQATENQNYPIETLLYKLDMETSAADFPLFDVVVLLENIHDKKYIRHIKPNMIFSFHRGEEYVDVAVEYRAALYKNKTVGKIIGHLKNLFQAVMLNLDLKISAVNILSEKEKKKVLFEFNDTKKNIVRDKSFPRLFEHQVEKTPDRIAAVYNGLHFTYNELNKEANRIACFLTRHGVKPGKIVSLYLKRSAAILASILGVFKAGGAYLPLEIEYPVSRIEYILKDSEANIVITETNHLEIVETVEDSSPYLQEILCLHHDKPVETIIPGLSFKNSNKPPLPGDLAYLIYTSGTTGMPKGVMIHQLGMINHLYAKINDLSIIPQDIIAQTASACFDISVWQFLSPLAVGAETVIIDREVVLEPVKLLSVLQEGIISILESVPSHMSIFLELLEQEEDKELKHLRWMIATGEVLSPFLVREWYKHYPGIKLVNAYGPTEASDDVTHYIVEDTVSETQFSIPVGKPIQNTHIYILDKNLLLCPQGVRGEICVSGLGVGKGYWKDPEKTGNAFIPNPYVDEIGDKDYALLYKTGDIGYFKDDGNIELIGRLDQQVKIRGNRIELGEIENRLLNYAAIREAVVLVKNAAPTDKFLCAYIVAEQEVEASELKDRLLKELPDHMVPLHYVFLDEMPLNPSGKIDRRALPDPEFEAGETYAAPRNELEEKLAEIWSGLLGIQKSIISVEANFFELGGNSLNATIMITRIHKILNVKVPLVEVFKTPMIRELSLYIESAEKAEYASIAPAEKKDYYVLSPAQKRLYILQQMYLENMAYNMTEVIPLPGKPEIERLERAFVKLIERHESLRTSFLMIDEKPVQKVHDEVEFEIEYNSVERRAESNFVRAFDLSKAPLLRVALVKLKDAKYLLMVDMHHIIADGISHEILQGDFMALSNGKQLPPLRIQYKDYSEWQTGEREMAKLEQQQKYWLEQFEDEIPALNLPTDYSRPPVQTFEGNTLWIEIGREETRALKKAALQEETTSYILLLAITNIFLSKLAGQEDIVMGTPVAGRRHADLEKIIGMFVNTLALRNCPAGEKTFKEFLKEVRERTLENFENQEYPFEELVERISVNRDVSRNPIFDVMFGLEEFNTGAAEAPEKKLQPEEYYYESDTSIFDMNLVGWDSGKDLSFSVTYNTTLFKQQTIERFIAYFKKIISDVSENIKIKIADIEIIVGEEKKRILYDFNNSEMEYPGEKTIEQLFREQVIRTPDGAAVVGKKERIGETVQLTYGELEEKSDILAHQLRCKGVGPDTVVGLMVDRSLEMMIGILAVIKSGGAYLPIDPVYPEERINYILKDSGAKILLTGPAARAEAEVKEESIERMDISKELTSSTSTLTSTLNKVSSANLVYIIYTSGSTGRPKGVMIQHRSLVNFIKGITDKIDFDVTDNILSLTTISFDIFGLETILPLTSGAKVIVGTREEQVNTEDAFEAVLKEAITILQVTPSRLSMFTVSGASMECLRPLKYLLVGGEAFPPQLLEKAREAAGGKIYNLYGPTETTIYSAIKEVSEGKALNIGKPIANTRIYILSGNRFPQPIGIPGELCIAGDGLARGYINNVRLTAEKFTAIPFEKGLKLYRTGDIARWLPDGNIEFSGRLDEQVKVRGFRIELGEIESCLTTHKKIKEAVVVCKSDGIASNHLCAYIVSPFDITPDSTELREYLSLSLPEYMIPSFFVFLDEIPLTPNGKINRKALPAPEISAGEAVVPPRNPVEEKLRDIWSQVLAIEKESIGIDMNFFQLGGHSLKATILLGKVHRALDVKLPLTAIFNTPTIRGMAGSLKGLTEDKYTGIEPVEQKEYYALSQAQKRLYILKQIDLTGTAYNIPQVIPLGDEIDFEKLQRTFIKLIERHESLRTSFHMKGDEPVQTIHNAVEFEIRYHDAQREEAPPAEIIRDFIRPFDLSLAPLLRVGLIKINSKESIIIVDTHHIISDGISHEILKRDFTALYKGEKLAPLRIQYKNFSVWQNKDKQKENVKQQGEYWLKEFGVKGEIPVLNLPTDYARPAVKSFEGESIDFEIGGSETRAIKEWALEEGLTLFILLLAVYYVLLAKLTGQEDIVVGTAVMGRPHPDLEPIIGMFINMVPLRNYPKGEMCFRDFLQLVKEYTLRALENQDYQFEDMVEMVLDKRDASRSPLFDVVFSLQQMEHSTANTPGLNVKPNYYENPISKFDMTFNGLDQGDNIYMYVEYCSKLFDKKTIEMYVENLKEILNIVLDRRDIKIKDIKISSDFLATKKVFSPIDFEF